MMSKKDYEHAAELVQSEYYRAYEHENMVGVDSDGGPIYDTKVAFAIENAFVRFFAADNAQFDQKRFRDACQVKIAGMSFPEFENMHTQFRKAQRAKKGNPK